MLLTETFSMASVWHLLAKLSVSIPALQEGHSNTQTRLDELETRLETRIFDLETRLVRIVELERRLETRIDELERQLEAIAQTPMPTASEFDIQSESQVVDQTTEPPVKTDISAVSTKQPSPDNN